MDVKELNERLKDPQEIFRIHKDPRVFLETYFPIKRSYDGRYLAGWETRGWQKDLFSTGTKRKLIRVSRRAGKSHTLMGYAIHQAYTKKQYRVVVITPSEKQAKELYDKAVNCFINENELIKMSCKITKDPMKITFFNGITAKEGSTIVFRTAGTKSGAKGEALRGIGADLLILDESAYLCDEDYNAILPLLDEAPHIELWMATTPNGKREKFYNLWNDMPDWTPDDSYGWAKHHFTCWEAIPDWDENKDREAKMRLGQNGYEMEYLANWGVELKGVFNKDRLDYAFSVANGDPIFSMSPPHFPTYGYAKYLNHTGKPRVMGVDWDKYGAGTTIVIAELDFKEPDPINPQKLNSNIKIIYKEIIPQSEYTLTNAVKTIISLVDRFHIDKIYSDSGLAEYQLEVLKEHYMNNPNKLKPEDIVRIHFKQNEEILDPNDGFIRKEEAKSLMIEILRNRIDLDMVIFNPKDEDLKKQFVDYCVSSISNTGKVIYTSVNEHGVDAVMLAVYGIVKNYEKFANYESKLYIEKGNTFTNIANRSNIMSNAVQKMNDKSSRYSEPDYEAPPVGMRPSGSMMSVVGKGNPFSTITPFKRSFKR
jgi:replicative DNA helicase